MQPFIYQIPPKVPKKGFFCIDAALRGLYCMSIALTTKGTWHHAIDARLYNPNKRKITVYMYFVHRLLSVPLDI